MVTAIEYEIKQSTMLRSISGDIKRKYLKIIKNLYNPKYKGEGDYMKSAEDWNGIISDLFFDDEEYLIVLELSIGKKVDLWKDEEWNSLMRIILPKQFRKRMASYTQVPKLAVMDDVREKVEDRPKKWW